MKKAGRLLCTVMVLALMATLLMPSGVLAAEDTEQIVLQPDTGTIKYEVGGPSSNVTELPHLKADWPKEEPELATQYVWYGSKIFVESTSTFDYHHRVVIMAERWIDHQPDVDIDPDAYVINDWEAMGHRFSVIRPVYIYFLYFDEPGAYTSACFAARIDPVVATVTQIQLSQPQPEDGFLLGGSVSLEPVWTVGIREQDSFVALPQLAGYPKEASIRWGRTDAAATDAVVEAADNTTRGADPAVLVTPEQGGALTYTATLQPASPVYVQPEPPECTVLWSSEHVPEEPVVPEIPAPDPPEGLMPETFTAVHFEIGGADSEVTELPYLKADWPKQEPEGLATKYAWIDSHIFVQSTTNFDYHHRGVYVADHWIDHPPTVSDPGCYEIGDWEYMGRTLAIGGTVYVYYLYYDQPGVYTSACYAARIDPAAATLSGIELAYPETAPEDGFALNDIVWLRPVWTVGDISGGTFRTIDGLRGCPKNAAVLWGIAGSEQTGAVDAENNMTTANDAALLVPPEEGALITYTASMDPQQSWRSLHMAETPAEMEVRWISDSAALPIQSAPDAAYTVEIVPSLDGSSSMLTGIPMIAGGSDFTRVGFFTEQITVPEGSHAVVRDRGGAELSADGQIGTGCSVEVVNAAGEVSYSVPVVIRGDVLGTGRLSIAQLTRLADAYSKTRPLAGPYMDAAGLLADTDSVTLTSMIAMARMLQTQSLQTT